MTKHFIYAFVGLAIASLGCDDSSNYSQRKKGRQPSTDEDTQYEHATGAWSTKVEATNYPVHIDTKIDSSIQNMEKRRQEIIAYLGHCDAQIHYYQTDAEDSDRKNLFVAAAAARSVAQGYRDVKRRLVAELSDINRVIGP